MDTVWVLGDQLNRAIGALATADPATHRVLLVESEAKLRSKPFHRQRLHLVLTAMRRFGDELRRAGFAVDHRRSADLATGLAEHRAAHRPGVVRATEPLSLAGRELLESLDVGLVRSNQFLCHPDEFAAWAAGRRRTRMEDFYRWQRRRLGYLMDGDEPVGGRWNYDDQNREPPPGDGQGGLFDRWPSPPTTRLDAVDREVLASLPDTATGREPGPEGWWATTRRGALGRLRHFVDQVLPRFGPHQDAMLRDDWHLAHAVISPYLNLGLLLPGEVCDAVEEAYRAGGVPLNSAEGFLRQVIGWREYVWGLYWLRMPAFRDENVLEAHEPLPPAFLGRAETQMNCLHHTLEGLDERGWIHHIQRLMVLANLSNLAGLDPRAVTDWMHARYVDGAEWVMVPNVIGMGLWADGGKTATKPYVSGGAYIDRMSDYCTGCRYDPRRRTGEDACPFTSLYWDYLARHRSRLAGTHRMQQPLRGLDRLSDLPAVRSRARQARRLLAAGRL